MKPIEIVSLVYFIHSTEIVGYLCFFYHSKLQYSGAIYSKNLETIAKTAAWRIASENIKQTNLSDITKMAGNLF